MNIRIGRGWRINNSSNLILLTHCVEINIGVIVSVFHAAPVMHVKPVGPVASICPLDPVELIKADC